MSVHAAPGGEIVLSGICGAGDAETLMTLLLAHPEAAVDWRDCQGAHGAVIQVLLAGRRRMLGPASDAFLSRWVEPLLLRR